MPLPLARSSFIKDWDVIAAACPLPERMKKKQRHHMLGWNASLHRCIRKVTNEDVLGSDKIAKRSGAGGSIAARWGAWEAWRPRTIGIKRLSMTSRSAALPEFEIGTDHGAAWGIWEIRMT